MEAYYFSCKENTTKEDSSVRKTMQNRLVLLSNCAVYGKKSINQSIKQYSTFLIIFDMISLK